MADADSTATGRVGSVEAASADSGVKASPVSRVLRSGSLSRRMIGIAAAWVLLLLVGGGIALDRVLVSAVTRNFDDQLDYVQTAMIASASRGSIS